MNIVIASCRYNPGHIGHLKAWYQLCKICGYKTELLLNKKYETYFDGEIYEYTTKIEDIEKINPDFAIIYNIGLDNIDVIKWCKKKKCQVLYVLHEPYVGFIEMVKIFGRDSAKVSIKYIANQIICNLSNKVILCSDYAEIVCKKYMRKTFEKSVRLPLIFLDGYNNETNIKRDYFSCIGSYHVTHGSDLFLKFIKESYEKNNGIKFQIVTKDNIEKEINDPILIKMKEQGRLLVQQGRTLTEDEMNEAYRKSIAVWSGYRCSIQSGVLANAFMQGTPSVASHLASFNEFIKEGETGFFINDFSYESILVAYEKVVECGSKINENCRDFFMKHFYYGSQKNVFVEIVESNSIKSLKGA